MKKENTSIRLKKIMSDRNLKQVDILELCKPYCQKFDVKLGRNDLSQYVSGKVEPGQQKLTVLGMALNVNEAWLMGYDVPIERKEWWIGADEEIKREKAFRNQLKALGWEYDFYGDDSFGKKPYYLFSQIGENGSFEVSCPDFDALLTSTEGFIKNRLQELANKYFGFETFAKKNNEITRIYTYYRKIACAGTGFYFDDIPTDTIEAPYMEGADFVIGVNGDSMEPDYHNGENLYIKKTNHINYKEVGIFTINNECYLKEYGRDGLISKNPNYKNIQGNEDIRLIGKVIGKVQND